MTAAEDQQQLTQSLLTDGETEALRQGLTNAVSECKLQDKCFLSVGTTDATEAYKKVQRKLVIACVLCFIFMIVEIVGGYIAKSVAIMSDAAHMLSDVSAFLVSIFAAWAATQPSSWHYSFGYHRAEILGALVSVLIIWAVTGALVFEAVQRTINPVRVDGKVMFIISVAGVCFNVLVALALGVHAHLGHSHGPGGCSGHGHSHGHDHDHEHEHGHDHSKHKHSHAHGHSHEHDHNHCGSGHSHKHGSNGCSSSHKKEDHSSKHSHAHAHAAGGSCGHDHDHAHEHSHHSHSHSHDSTSGCSSSSAADDDSSKPLLAEQQAAAAAAPSTAAWTADAAAGTGGGPSAHEAGAVKECIVIDLPASGGPNCGLDGHAVTCRCTISRKGSHEIEVRCELPAPALLKAAPGAEGAASARRSSGHGHGHSHDHSHDGGNINLRGAVLHVIGDILQSIGVAIAGALIWYNQDDPRWYIADPICTFIFSIVVLLTTKSILRDIIHVLMERTPTNIDIPAMSQVISDMEGVRDVHDLHIWNISTSTSPVLTAHVHIGPDADANTVLQKLEQYVRGVGIQHSTIQICNPLQPAA